MINREIEELLKNLNVKAVYSSPAELGELPCVSYYTLSEKGSFSCDNEECIVDVRVQLDIWADKGYKCGDIAEKVKALMKANGYSCELSMDIPKGNDNVYHKSLRFIKSYLV